MNIIKKTIFLLGIVFFFSMENWAQSEWDFIVTCGSEAENMGNVEDEKFIVGIKRCYKISQNTEFTFTWYNSEKESINEIEGLIVFVTPKSFDLTLDDYNVLKLTLKPGVYDMTFKFNMGYNLGCQVC